MDIVTLENVHKQFDQLSAINGISLSIKAGDVLGLLGHNGAGKTTTIKLILGLLNPSQGNIEVFGTSPTSQAFKQKRKKIGFVQENVAFYPQLTGFETLFYFAQLKGYKTKHCHLQLEQFGLSHAANQKLSTYSKGMKQRLGLAQALLAPPSLLLLDEPTAGLDPVATQLVYKSVDSLKKQGCTIILCSHELNQLTRHIDHAAILLNGELQAYGCIEILQEQLHLPFIVSIQGKNLINQLPSQLKPHVHSYTHEQLVLIGKLNDKFTLLQAIGKLQGVIDFDWKLPTLEDVYLHCCG